MGESMKGWGASVSDYKFTYLLVALLVLILTPLIVGQAVTRSLTFGFTIIGVLIFGLLATLQHRKARVVALVLGVLGAVTQVHSFAVGAGRYPEWRLAAFTAFLAFLVVIIVWDVLKAEAVTWDKIQGALCAYLLIGLTWGLLHHWVVLHNPEAYRGAMEISGDESLDSMLYYSFVTLTTLGYGDITPVSHTARTLSWLEAAFGQIYLTVLVARLVGLHLTRSTGSASQG